MKKKHTKKNNKEYTEHAELLVKRRKEAKGEHQIVKRWRLSPLRAPTSTFESVKSKIF